jgi:putative AbiEi antitoxin of type IV toxin-antitoxin system
MGRKDSFQRLYETVEAQQGFFTTKQAKAAGFAENTHPYHVRAGNWIREHRGIYRVALFPQTDHPDLALWSLWSRNRNEETEGVFSHQTALSLHELSDINPSKLHMTVPRHFRRNSEIPGVLVLHRGEVPASDIQTAQGFHYTRPLRAILDLVEAGTVEQSILRQAAKQALERGLITRAELKRARLSEAAARLFAKALRRVAEQNGEVESGRREPAAAPSRL